LNVNAPDEKVINLSKKKVLLLIAGSCAFVAGGLWMLLMDSSEIRSQHRFNNPLMVHGIGAICIVLFGLAGVWGIRKLFDKKPGLVLSAAGMLDNTGALSVGLIPWSEIVGFETFEVYKTKMLIVQVADPEKYIKVGGAAKRALKRANSGMSGSPISISSTALKISFDELLDLCNRYYAKYGGKVPQIAAIGEI